MLDAEFKLENGAWWAYTEGADGLKWYRMGPETEECVDQFGNRLGITAKKAIESNENYYLGSTGNLVLSE